MQEEKGRIIFFPTKHFPPYLELSRLEDLQTEFEFAQVQIAFEENYDKYNIMLRKQMLANRLRETLHIVSMKK